jgi:hypothetical protein
MQRIPPNEHHPSLAIPRRSAGLLAVKAGLSVVPLNLLYRMSMRGDRERKGERAEETTGHLEEHGAWPAAAQRSPQSVRETR